MESDRSVDREMGSWKRGPADLKPPSASETAGADTDAQLPTLPEMLIQLVWHDIKTTNQQMKRGEKKREIPPGACSDVQPGIRTI